jgi:hypothetical protein
MNSVYQPSPAHDAANDDFAAALMRLADDRQRALDLAKIVAFIHSRMTP